MENIQTNPLKISSGQTNKNDYDITFYTLSSE